MKHRLYLSQYYVVHYHLLEISYPVKDSINLQYKQTILTLLS